MGNGKSTGGRKVRQEAGKGSVTVSNVYTRLKERIEIHKDRYVVMAGGSRSTKTYSILQHIIMQCLHAPKPLEVLIVRAKLTWLKATVLKDFKDIMKTQFGIWDEDAFNKADMTYTLNGSAIEFEGLDQEAGFQKAHGLKGDIVFFNEAIELEYGSVQQILMRSPGYAIFDFNPNCGLDHWMYSKIMTRERCGYIHSTYRDNPFVEDSVVQEIESYEPTDENVQRGTSDEILWKIYGLGERNVVTGLVYPSYSLIKKFPDNCEKVGLGLDFGFSNDPTAIVKCGLKQGSLYFEELCYRRGLTTIINPHNIAQPSIEKELKKHMELVNVKTTIWCDGQRPDSIRDLQNCGFQAKAAPKGAGSILAGIYVVKRHPLFVVETSMNMIKELNNYKWQVDRNGEPTNVAVDKFNHILDGARYFTVGEFGMGFGQTGRFDSARVRGISETYEDA